MSGEGGKKPRPLPGAWVDEWRRAPGLKPGVRLILYALANYMDQGGKAWPSVASLARDIGQGERNTQRLLREAEESGWLTRIRSRGDSGTTLYVAVRGVTVVSPWGDRGVRGEVTVVSPKCTDERPLERPKKTLYENPLYDGASHAPLSFFESILGDSTFLAHEDGTRDEIPELLAVAPKGLTGEEVDWLLGGLERAIVRGEAGTPNACPVTLTAIVLRDMARKAPGTWSRKRFLGFMERLVALHTDSTGEGIDADEAFMDPIREAWR